jgi:hypothetical protein
MASQQSYTGQFLRQRLANTYEEIPNKDVIPAKAGIHLF